MLKYALIAASAASLFALPTAADARHRNHDRYYGGYDSQPYYGGAYYGSPYHGRYYGDRYYGNRGYYGGYYNQPYAYGYGSSYYGSPYGYAYGHRAPRARCWTERQWDDWRGRWRRVRVCDRY